MSKKILLLFVAIYSLLIVLLSMQILTASAVILKALDLAVVIVISIFVGAYGREYFLLREKEREAQPVYRLTDDPGEIDLAEGLLHRELFKPFGLDRQVWEEQCAARWMENRQGVDRYFVARLGDEVIAAMVLRVEGDTAELRLAAVAGEHRGKNIGISLWNIVHAYARREQIRTIVVYTRNTAFGFWRRCGLEEASEKWIELDSLAPYNIRYKKMQIDIAG